MLLGNTAAAEFDRLLREHIPALYRCAYRWTGTTDRAEDLVQELLLRLYPKLDELRGLDSVRPWAIRVMYRIFIDQLRRERSSPVQFGVEPMNGDAAGDEHAEPIDELDEPPQLVEQQLTQQRIVAAWAQLAEEHRVVLSLHDIEGYSLVELSPMMEVPLGTLKSRLHRARTKLRELLVRERLPASDRVYEVRAARTHRP
jgi:RNA polymerase sigma-70 factor (ECF subfamily)